VFRACTRLASRAVKQAGFELSYELWELWCDLTGAENRMTLFEFRRREAKRSLQTNAWRRLQECTLHALPATENHTLLDSLKLRFEKWRGRESDLHVSLILSKLLENQCR
jgi:hypothetical protein